MHNYRVDQSSYILFFLTLLFLFFVPINKAYSKYACIPTCDVTDGKAFAFSGLGLATSNENVLELSVRSAQENLEFEIGIFDGDADNAWDLNSGTPGLLDVVVYLDPNEDGSGTIQIAQWSSDGSFGDNAGLPMPDNDWFNRTLINTPGALNTDGSYYSYKVLITFLTPEVNNVSNTFKVRSDGFISIVREQPFSYLILITDDTAFNAVYPNTDFDDPACFDPVAFSPYSYCDPIDPNCCLNNNNYDGVWEFNFIVPEGVDKIDIWDGDLDFGSSSFDADGNCDFADGVDVDTNDPNTPDNIIPEWAEGTSVVFEGISTPTNPSDDAGCSRIISRPPSVIYSLISPTGIRYINNNPSGTEEWELYNIGTGPVDPVVRDVSVAIIEPGLWTLRVEGNDLTNLNAFRLPYAIIGVDDEGFPVVPEGPSTPVPTLNQSGLFVFVLVALLMAIYFIKRKKIYS